MPGDAGLSQSSTELRTTSAVLARGVADVPRASVDPKDRTLTAKYFIQALGLPEMADYKRKFSRQGAERSIQSAETAIKLAEKVLENI